MIPISGESKKAWTLSLSTMFSSAPKAALRRAKLWTSAGAAAPGFSFLTMLFASFLFITKDTALLRPFRRASSALPFTLMM